MPAAIAVQNAQVLEQTKRLASQLQAALSTRGVIERAIGIMMSRSGGTEAEALDRLRSLSQHQHEKLPSHRPNHRSGSGAARPGPAH